MQHILRVQVCSQFLQNQTSKWIIYRSFRLNTLSMNLSAHDQGKMKTIQSFGRKRIEPVLLDSLNDLATEKVPRARITVLKLL